MTPKTWLFAALAALTVLRLWVASSIELAPDEAYYFLWSKHPDICYFSKGPGVAAAIWIGTHLFGDHSFGIRFFSPILSAGSSLILFALARRMFSESVGLWTLVTLSCLPILNVGSVLMTIDPLSIFFWAAAMYTFWRALERIPAPDDPDPLDPGWSAWWPVTGALVGLGFLCKWTNAMQLISIVWILSSSGRLRRNFRQPGIWSLLLVFVIFLLPPLIWNAQHAWITLTHVSQRGGLNSPFRLSLTEPLVFLALHLGVYSPGIFGGLLVGLRAGCRLTKDHFKPRFLTAFSVPLLLMYFLLSFKKAGEANWTAPAMLSLGIFAVAHWLPRAMQSRGVRRYAGVSFGVGLVMSTLILDTDLLRKAGLLRTARDPSSRLRGWQSTAEAVQSLREQIEQETGRPVFLIGNSYGTAAILGFYLPGRPVEGPGHPPVYIIESQNIENQFSFWPRYDEFLPLRPGQKPRDPLFSEEGGYNPFHGRTALYVTTNAEGVPPSAIQSGFESAEMVALYELQRRGQPLRQIRVFRCTNYRSVSL